MAHYRISGPARQDLREIHDWISRDDRAAADRVLLEFRRAMEMLAGMPGLGHVRDDLADSRLRAWTVRRYVGIFPDDASIIRLVGAVLLDVHDEWQVAERAYFSDASMKLIDQRPDDQEAPAELDAA